MTGVLRAELLKLRTTRTTAGLTAGLVAVLALVVLVHGFALSAEGLTRDGQLHVFGLAGLGVVFASLLGALSITGELRTGTMRPTLLTTPARGRVLAAKLVVTAVAGAAYGLLAAAVTIGLGLSALSIRGIPNRLTAGDYGQLVSGGVLGGALWACLGLSLATVVRNQVGTLVGLCAWLLFLESVLLSQLPDVVRWLPGTAAAALSGSTVSGEVPSSPGLLDPVVAGLVLAGYVVAAFVIAVRVFRRRDIG